MNYSPASQSLPFGVDELDSLVHDDPQNNRIRCFVRGCSHWLSPPARGGKGGQSCPDHGIYCHKTGTYRYKDIFRNIIVDADRFSVAVHGNSAKFDTARFGMESSEDALSWNVFRSLKEAGLLAKLVRELIGESSDQQPTLWLWGLDADARPPRFWDLLTRARDQFEKQLPSEKPLTEPDIALHVPGEYLVLIEAKFTSKNPIIERNNPNPRDRMSLAELIKSYAAPNLRIVDRPLAERADAVPEQLWRNLVFAEAMAADDGPSTRAYVVNLVRDESEPDSAKLMNSLIHPEFQSRFRRATWEQLFRFASGHRPATDRLCRYLKNKTARLRPAFRIP